MSEPIVWGVVQRSIEALAKGAPTILVGLVVAGIFRRLLGHEHTRRLFGVGTWRELPQAWLLGMLLPVCSLGVIPIARELRRAGLSGGTILAFAMTAPLFNPVSILYGLSLADPVVTLSFALCSLVVVTVVGATWDRLFPGSAAAEPAPPPVAFGLRRMAAVLVVGARELAGPGALYLLLGLAGAGLLSAFLPPGSLQAAMEHDNPYAALTMTAVAIPAYATPMVAMAQIGSMFQHGNSVASAFVLLTLGAGTNVGLIAWMFRAYGLRRGLAWSAILLAVVLGLAYALEAPLYPKGIDPAGHTHAFDIYCRPSFPADTGLGPLVARKLQQETPAHEVTGLLLLLGLAAAGGTLKLLDRRWRIEDWLEGPPAVPERPGRYDVVVPGPVLGGVALVGLVSFSVFACYTFYPPARQVFEDMTVLQAEVLATARSGDRDHALHFIPHWEDWTRRLQVGVYLREGRLSAYRRMKTRIFRDRLELLKHALEEGDRAETRESATAVAKAYRRMRAAYLKE